MWWNSRFAKRSLFFFALALTAGTSTFASDPILRKEVDDAAPVEMSFTKGDTRNGSKVQIRIVGDSLYYREVTYYPNAAPLESRKTMGLSSLRRKALHGVLGELPRYPAFGSCYGKDMRFYMVEAGGAKFYRSLPERSGKCYADEPGIWSLLQDLDDLLAPPSDPDFQEYSAS